MKQHVERLILILLLIFAMTPAPVTANVSSEKPQTVHFTLQDLYSRAMEDSESIKQAQENVLIAQKDKQRALSVLIPRLTAFGSYTLSDYDMDTSPPVTGDPPSMSIEDNALSWGVSVNQSFTLNGKELTALGIAEDSIEKSEYDLTTITESYLFEVAGAYYSVIRSRKSWQIAEESVRRLEKHKEFVKARLELDAVTKTDLFRAESELSEARATLIQDKNLYRYSRAALRTLVPLPDDFTLEEPVESLPTDVIPDLKSLKDQGLAQRTEIKSARKSQDVSEKNVKLSKGDFWPTLSLEAQYGSENNDYGGTLDYEQDTTGYSLGATLTFTLYDGGLRRAEIAQAHAQERQARLSLTETSKQISLEIEEAYLQVITQKSRLSSLNDRVSFSKQNYLAVSEQYKHGIANSVDMMDANTILVSAQRGLSEAFFSYKLALLRLKRTTGAFYNEAMTDITKN